MSYWGCSTFPNAFLGSRAEVISLISSPHGSVQNFSDLQQKSSAKSVTIARTIGDSYRSIPVESVSGFYGETFMVRSLGLRATSVVYASGGNSASKEQKVEAINMNYDKIVTPEYVKNQVADARSIILPVQVSPDMYYWVEFEEIEEDDNTTEFE